jgi:tight adherence protein C
MSDLFLPFILATSFGAFLLVAVAMRLSITEARRPVQLLEAHVREAGIDLREEQLSEDFVTRVMSPLVKALAGLARRISPVGARDRVAKKLVFAGAPSGWDAERVLAFKGLGLILGGPLAYSVAGLLNFSPFFRVLFAGLGALTLFLIPGAMLGQAVVRRQESIRRALPDTLDLLSISVEAGLGFDAALMQVSRKVPGALSQEIGRMIHEMQLGSSRANAFRHLADRITAEEVRGFVLAMIQADVFGVSIANVLRAQSRELRIRRRQRAEERAMKIPVKLLFPMIFCILPALFVVIVGPGIIQISQSLFGPTPLIP